MATRRVIQAHTPRTRLTQSHIRQLVAQRRIAVALDWTWSYLTFDRGARLITGDIEDEHPARAAKRDAA